MEDNSCILVKRLKTESNLSESTDFVKTTKDSGQEVGIKSDRPDQCELSQQDSGSIPDRLLQIEIKYSEQFSYLTFVEPITHVYNPLRYAFNLHSQYVHKFCQSEKEVLILGMNPGPWGMSQTGVPFGEISEVRDWLGITGEVGQPEKENPHRPITGLSCHRSEVSGKRFWAALKKAFGKDPYLCFKSLYVHNYCPLAFMNSAGRNITPTEIKAHEKQELLRICDDLLIEVLLLLNVKTVVAVGRFAAAQSRCVIKNARLDYLKLLSVPHPSPRNAGASFTWEDDTAKILQKLLSKQNS